MPFAASGDAMATCPLSFKIVIKIVASSSQRSSDSGPDCRKMEELPSSVK
jgi:hypothetical protein